MQTLSPFHLAIPVSNLEASRKFYGEILNLEEGRSSEHWTDYNFFGHQLVIHQTESSAKKVAARSKVDDKEVPIPHFGVVLNWEDFFNFYEEIKNKKITFEITPYIRFKGLAGEQVTMFFYDPSQNALEFKAFKNPEQLFAK